MTAPGREALRARVDGDAVDDSAGHRAADTIGCFDHGHLEARAHTLPGHHETCDAPAHDDHPRGRGVDRVPEVIPPRLVARLLVARLGLRAHGRTPRDG